MALSQRDRSLDTAIIMISMSVPPYQPGPLISILRHRMRTVPWNLSAAQATALHTADISSRESNSGDYFAQSCSTTHTPCVNNIPASPLIPSPQRRIVLLGSFTPARPLHINCSIHRDTRATTPPPVSAATHPGLIYSTFCTHKSSSVGSLARR